MKIGIRTKLLALLVVVALLPLIAALITITVGSRQHRTEQFGRSISSAASVQAMALWVSLSKDIEKFNIEINDDPDIMSVLGAVDQAPDMSEIDAIEAGWGDPTSRSGALLKEILARGISRRLMRIQADDPLIAEILVTDRFGALAAATQKTSDYYQADEDWWRGAWCKGDGCIYTPPVSFDKSAGIWSIDVCIPIRSGRQVVGVAKFVVDISAWVKMRTGGKIAMIGSPPIPGSIMLVRKSGEIFYHDNRHRHGKIANNGAHLEKVAQWYGAIAFGLDPGWRFTNDGMLQGFAPLKMPETIGANRVDMPSWLLVVSVPSSEVLKPVRQMVFKLLWIGLPVIILIFVCGIFLVERGLVRRIRWLGTAAKSVADGDLSHRIQDPRSLRALHGRDEIDQLTDDFNAMLVRIDKSHRKLTEANELKTNFIRVAGHELRTPVAYIMAMTKMLKSSDDVERLGKAVATMGDKANRLAEIIDSIFKLLPEHGRSRSLIYEDVNLPDLLEEVYLDCKPFMDPRGQKFIIESGDDIPRLRVDRGKLRDVLENLVVNAIKFSPDDGSIKLTAGRQLGGYITISIEDQGPGIADEDLPHVFDPFYSTRDVMKHSSGQTGYQKRGMGLGLAIVRHFAELHGGAVHVSTSDKGSVFTVSIPLQPPRGDGADG